MGCLAVIPARGGSKGIPRKNLQEIGGRSLVARGIDTCMAAAAVDEVLVTTDDVEIAEAARSAGADVIQRPPELADNFIMPDPAVAHALKEYKATRAKTPEIVLFLQCTSPLTHSSDIDGAYKKFIETSADSLVAVTPAHAFLWQETQDGGLSAINHDSSVRLGRQEINGEFRETGSFYMMRVAVFLEKRHRFFGRVVGYEIPAERAVDIDTPFDLKLAKLLLKSQAN